MSLLFRPLASTSKSSIRSIATLPLSPPPPPHDPNANKVKLKSGNPKRDPTLYGIPSPVPAIDWPKRAETDTKGHPLWQFFHGGESLEVPDRTKDNSGRAWTSYELRKKDFKELHQLWYVLVKERNVLYTQREEARRQRLDLSQFTSVPDKIRMVQKSQARIKQVLSERRHAALEAAAILRAGGEVDKAEALEKVAEEGAALV